MNKVNRKKYIKLFFEKPFFQISTEQKTDLKLFELDYFFKKKRSRKVYDYYKLENIAIFTTRCRSRFF